MTDTTPAELQRRLAGEFDRQGWEYNLTVGRRLVEEIERCGEVHGDKLVQLLPAEFFERNRTSRGNVAAAIERAVGGRTPKRAEQSATVVVNNTTYSMNLGSGSRITKSNINVGDGIQINLDVSTRKDDVLAGLEALLRSGLAGNWNQDAARDLAAVIDRREDVSFEDIRQATTEIVKAARPKQSKAKAMLTAIATSGLGGALSSGISSGMGEVLHLLPT